MKPETYAVIAERYKQKYESYGRSGSRSSFKDVGNLVWNPEEAKEIFATKTGDERKKYLKWFAISVSSLKNYFRLLDMNTEYREAEIWGDMVEGDVGFPDLMKYSKSKEGLLMQEKIFGDSPQCKAHYMLLSKQRLEDIAQSEK